MFWPRSGIPLASRSLTGVASVLCLGAWLAFFPNAPYHPSRNG